MQHRKEVANMLQNQGDFRKKWTVATVVLASIGIAVTVLLTLQSPCAFKEWLGMPCPGCGMTRAALSFFKGDIAGVNRWHPMFWGLFPLAGYLIACIFSQKLRKKVWIPLLLFGLGMVICWVIRMVLFFPDTPPMDVNPDAWLFQWVQ